MTFHQQSPANATFLTEKQVAEMICQSVRTIQKWRTTGHGPAFHKFGQSVRYSLADVHDWIGYRRVSRSSPRLTGTQR